MRPRSSTESGCFCFGWERFRTVRKRVEINSARKRGVTYLAGQLGSPVYTDGDHTHGFKNMFFDPTRRDLSIGATFEALKTFCQDRFFRPSKKSASFGGEFGGA